MSQPTLSTPRLILRPYQADDAPALQRYAGLREIADTTLNIPHPYPDGLAAEWIATHAPKYAARELATFAITRLGGELVGTIGLRLEPDHRRAELGYWVAPAFWNQGIATEASLAMLRFGFADLELNRIQATHLSRNPASGRVMQKIGMTFEGCHRQYLVKNGKLEDLLRYAILASDPQVA